MEIVRLQERIRTLTLQGRRLRDRPNNVANNEIKIGNRVRILSNHRNLGGTTGTVIGATSAQVTIRPDDKGNKFRRYKQNVEIIDDE